MLGKLEIDFESGRRAYSRKHGCRTGGQVMCRLLALPPCRLLCGEMDSAHAGGGSSSRIRAAIAINTDVETLMPVPSAIPTRISATRCRATKQKSVGGKITMNSALNLLNILCVTTSVDEPLIAVRGGAPRTAHFPGSAPAVAGRRVVAVGACASSVNSGRRPCAPSRVWGNCPLQRSAVTNEITGG
jgi:hypothetical protein